MSSRRIRAMAQLIQAIEALPCRCALPLIAEYRERFQAPKAPSEASEEVPPPNNLPRNNGVTDGKT